MPKNNQSISNIKIIEIIRENIDDSISMDDIDINSNLVDVGVDSIKFIKIVITIETEFDFEFGYDDLDFNKFLTVKSLVDYVENIHGDGSYGLTEDLFVDRITKGDE